MRVIVLTSGGKGPVVGSLRVRAARVLDRAPAVEEDSAGAIGAENAPAAGPAESSWAAAAAAPSFEAARVAPVWAALPVASGTADVEGAAGPWVAAVAGAVDAPVVEPAAGDWGGAPDEDEPVDGTDTDVVTAGVETVAVATGDEEARACPPAPLPCVETCVPEPAVALAWPPPWLAEAPWPPP